MDQILERCQGCIGITDDITVHGCTKVEHDTHLQNLMCVACKYGFSIQPTKTHVKAQTVKSFGCLYDADGAHPDPDKVDTIHALPAPTNTTKLQEFLGMVMYLSPFIPDMSTLTAPLHELLKKDTDFTWNHTYNTAFQHVKDAVISDTTLQYFDPSLPIRTATKYASATVLFTTTWDTYMNAVSSMLTLFQMPQQPHCRLLPDPVSLYHNLHPLGLLSPCHLCLLHLQCLWLQTTDHSCSHHTNCPKGNPCAYACDTQHSRCAAQEIRSCLHSTQAPDTRDVTIPQPMRGEPDPKHPWTSPLSFMCT